MFKTFSRRVKNSGLGTHDVHLSLKISLKRDKKIVPPLPRGLVAAITFFSYTECNDPSTYLRSFSSLYDAATPSSFDISSDSPMYFPARSSFPAISSPFSSGHHRPNKYLFSLRETREFAFLVPPGRRPRIPRAVLPLRYHVVVVADGI